MQYRAPGRFFRPLLVMAGVSVAVFACSSDGGSKSDDGDGIGLPPESDAGAGAAGGGGGAGGVPPRSSGSVYEDLGIEDPNPEEFHFDEVPAPYDDVDGCKAFESAYPDIHSCSCDSCYDLQRQCDALESCREIAECGISIGCSDAFDCYLVPADPKCVPIIDKWGNTGVASALSLQLGECTITNGCR